MLHGLQLGLSILQVCNSRFAMILLEANLRPRVPAFPAHASDIQGILTDRFPVSGTMGKPRKPMISTPARRHGGRNPVESSCGRVCGLGYRVSLEG